VITASRADFERGSGDSARADETFKAKFADAPLFGKAQDHNTSTSLLKHCSRSRNEYRQLLKD
jgi:hypothetical protein